MHRGVCMAQVQSPTRLCPPCLTPLPVCQHTPPHPPFPPGCGLGENVAQGPYLMPLSCLKDTMGSWLSPNLGLRLCLWPPGLSTEAHSLWGALLGSDHSLATHSG